MSIDLARELTVRAVAHALSERFSFDAEREDVEDYAFRLARMMNPDAAGPLGDAAIALWESAGGRTAELSPISMEAR